MNWLLKLMYKYNYFIGIEKLYTFLPYHFGRGKSFHPVSLVFIADYRCNTRCQHCLYWNDKNKPKTAERVLRRKSELLSVFDINKMLEQAKDIGIKTLSIHGGEPTIYKHFELLLGLANKLGFTINFFTNGAKLTSKQCKTICENNVNIVTFSIHGTEEVHDAIVRRKGTYKRIMRSIENFRQLKDSGYEVPDLRASTTIQKANQSNLFELWKKLYSTQTISNWTVQLPWVLDAVEDDVTNVDPIIVMNEKDQFRKVSGCLPKVTFSTDEAINSLRNSAKTYKAMSYCPGLYTRLYVNPYGDVVPCVSLDAVGQVLGNVKYNNLRSIWNGGEFVNYRYHMKGNLPDLCSYCCFIDRMEVL